jgi:hypothetical protein
VKENGVARSRAMAEARKVIAVDHGVVIEQVEIGRRG